MKDGWTIGSLAGVDIRVHPTFVVLLALAAIGLLGPPVEGLTWIVIVFSSVVFHELAHALVARSRGLHVRDIVLLPIGGASEIDGLPGNAGDELVVAAAGPASSLALGTFLLACATMLHGALPRPTLVSGGLFPRAGWMNIMLGTFNLLPALPMDGGRILRAVLTTHMGIVAATRRASAVSRYLAFALAAAGVVWMPWLLVIALFVYVTGRAEEAAVILHDLLHDVKVRDLMIPLVAAAPHETDVVVGSMEPVDEAAQRIASEGVDAAVVVDENGATIGVLDLDDVAAFIRTRQRR